MRKLLMRAAVVGVSMLVALSTPVAHAFESRAFGAADLLSLERISDPQVSPDGRYLVFTVNQPDLEANTSRSGVWLLDLTKNSSEAMPLIRGTASDWNGRWAPDSQGLYFLSTRSGSSQVWRVGIEDGAAAQVTRLPLDIDTLKVSPRGDRLLVSVEVFPDCGNLECTAQRLQTAEKIPATGRVYDRLFVRHWDKWADGRQSHLFSIAISRQDRTARLPVDLSAKLDADVPSKPRGGDEEFSFSPDGSRVAFTARVKGRTEAWSTNFDVYETAADGRGEPRNLTTGNPAWDAEPAYSPDGRLLAWKAMNRAQNEADRFHLVLRDLRSGTVRTLAGDWDRSISQFAFAADGQHIFATTDHLGQHPLWSIDLKTGKPALVQAQGQVTEFAVGRQFVVYALAALDAPVDLYRISAGGGQADRLTHFNAERLAGLKMSAFEQFSFKGWNGEPVYGYLVRPFDFAPGRKYPVAFIVHGGPQLSYSNGWSYRWNPQVYAGAGYAVLLIDFHGSTGYGQAFTDSITGDWGGKPIEDLRRGLIATLQKYPWLDGERVCGLGASYSGYLMNWIEGAWPDGFRCLVNQSGVFDTRSMYYETDEMWLDEYEHGGAQFEKPASYDLYNPILEVAKWRTPMLVGHGQLDFNVPYNQGIATFTALQRLGIESRLIVFPDEGHFILKPQNSLQWHREVIAWLDQWLKPDSR